MSSMYNQTVTVGSATSSTPFKVKAPAAHGEFGPGYLPPSLLASVSNGAVITFNVEVSGDGTNWVAFTNATGLTSAWVDTLGAAVCFIRVNVTSWTSGSVTLQFIQQVE